MSGSEGEIDRVFHALADATRRDIVAVRPGKQSVSRLAGGYPMSFAAVQKHVAVLERAGLVTKAAHGREQLVRTDRRRRARPACSTARGHLARAHRPHGRPLDTRPRRSPMTVTAVHKDPTLP